MTGFFHSCGFLYSEHSLKIKWFVSAHWRTILIQFFVTFSLLFRIQANTLLMGFNTKQVDTFFTGIAMEVGMLMDM